MLSSIENISLTLTNNSNSKNNSVSTTTNNNNNNNSNNNTNTTSIIISNSSNNNNNNSNSNKNQENLVIQNNGKVPKAILICHPSSHTFLDRTLILDKPVKVGRSVGHAKAALSNGIFDCKVLSRNHALIWYGDEKFYLKDTKSSNGTFVNRERLSRSVEESNPQEIYSGDTVQFGVDVVESSHNVTHGCIIATLKLILPDGREAKPKPIPVLSSSDKSKVSLEDLYHLNEYIQEALQREQMLEMKLIALRQLVQTLRESTELSWKALISNNSLLSRVELLEVQLQCYSKKFAEDKLREELRLLQEDKNNYQGAVKEFFQKIVDEKLEAVQHYQDLARALVNSRTECNNTKQLLTGCQNELRELAHKNTLQEKTIEELENKLSLAEDKNKELLQKLSDTTHELQDRIKLHDEREDTLQQTVRDLESRGDCTEKQVVSLQCQVEELQKYHNKILRELIDPDIIKEKINNIELIRSWISIYTEAQKKMLESVITIRNEVNELKNEKITKQQRITVIECELDKCTIELQDNKDEEMDLDRKIHILEKELEILKPVPNILDCAVEEIIDKKSKQIDLLLIELQDKRKLQAVIQRNIKILDDKSRDMEIDLQNIKESIMKLTVAYVIEEHKLGMAEKQNLNLEVALKTLQEYLENSNAYCQDLIPVEEVQSLKRQLSEAHEISLERQNIISCLTKYFSEFTNIVNQKLNVLEISLEQFVECSKDVYELDQTLKSIKMDSDMLADAITDLQTILCESLPNLSPVELTNTENEKIVNITDNVDVKMDINNLSSSICLQDKEITDLRKDMLILKEKYRHVLNEKLMLKGQLAKLREDYNYATSYPYFDLCFIMPIVILVCIFFFKYGNIFSVFSATSD